ncbi:MAG: hypothetical protein HC787_10305 [Nostocaceae cyanobacterium CSU_2_110]|nr:hypothetical protein [Nostocaceae cyanobacterium CSU_2_110]
MLTNKQFNSSSYLSFLVGLAGVGIGVAVGFGAGAIPVVVGLLLGVVAVLIFFLLDLNKRY